MKLIVAGVVAATVALSSSAGLPLALQQEAAPQISYEEFMKLGHASRRQRFAQVDAGTKAAIMRSHIAAWLAKNRGRLSTGQVAVVQDAIEFVTPELYESPTTRDLMARSEALQARLACRLRRSDILTAFKPSDPPKVATWLEDSSAWFSACLLGL